MPTEDQIIKILEKYQLHDQKEPPWPTFNPQDSRAYPVNWESLFPNVRRREKDGEYEWDVYGDDWQLNLGNDFENDLQGALESGYPTEDEIRDMARGNLWDVCAWYQPIYYYKYQWGIFIRQDCILRQALRIARFIPKPVKYTRGLARAIIRSSTYAYFLHEQYHHKVESLAIRLTIVDQSPIYAKYFSNVYVPSIGTNDQLEEALANANCYRRLVSDPYWQWISWPIVKATQQYLKVTFPHEPPGYSESVKYLVNTPFENGENILHSRVHEATTKTKQPATDWVAATHMIQSLYNVTEKIWCVINPSGIPILPIKQPWP